MANGIHEIGSHLLLQGYLDMNDNRIKLGLTDQSYIETGLSDNSVNIINDAGIINIASVSEIFLDAPLTTVNKLVIDTIPVLDNAEDDILVILSDGSVARRSASTLGSGVLVDGVTIDFNTAGELTVIGGGGGGGIQSLNGLVTFTQSFINDTNISIVSSGSTHTITWSGILDETRGGTGVGTWAAGEIPYATGVNTLAALGAGSAGTFLRAGGIGVPVAWSTTSFPNSAAAGSIIYASSVNNYDNLASAASGNALLSNGVGSAPSWGKIGLSTHITGTLPILNGGTGQTTAQAAINALTQVTGATNGFVLTKDTGTGNAVFKALQVFSGPAQPGIVPDPVVSTGRFLKDNGIWDTIPGGGNMLSTNNLSDVANALTSFNNIKQPATETYQGVIEIATQAEVDAGLDTTRAVTPATLANANVGGTNPAFGAGYSYDESEGQSDTTSGAYQTKLVMTSTSLPLGTYLISFYAEIKGSATNNDVEVVVEDNTSQIIAQKIFRPSNAGEWSHFSGIVEDNLTGINSYTIKWRNLSITGSPTASIRRARVAIWQVY